MAGATATPGAATGSTAPTAGFPRPWKEGALRRAILTAGRAAALPAGEAAQEAARRGGEAGADTELEQTRGQNPKPAFHGASEEEVLLLSGHHRGLVPGRVVFTF